MSLGINVSSHPGLRDKRAGLTTGSGSSPHIGHRSLAGVLALGTALAGCSASGRDGGKSPLTCKEVPYQGDSLGCGSDAECPAGTNCSAADPRQCVPAVFPEIDESVLILGFEVPEIEFHRDQAVTGPVAFEADLTSEVVGLACSLFVAEPVVAGGNAGRVVNASVSIYRSHVFRIDPASNGSLHTVRFGIGDLTATAVGQACSSPLADLVTNKGGHYPIVSMLKVGCIGYGSARVIGATRLRNVALADLPEAQMVLTDCSGQEQSGTAARFCMAPEALGHCAQGVCQSASTGTAANTPDSAAPITDTGADAGATLASTESPSPIPVSKCDACNEGHLCTIPNYFIGRCIGSLCAPVEIGNIELPLVVSNCDASFKQTDGLNCYDSQVEGYGTCLAKACRTRCVTISDCTETYGQFAIADPVCAHPRASPDSAPGYLGLCLPRPWFEESVAAPPTSDAGLCGTNNSAGDSASGSVEPRPDNLSNRFCVGKRDPGGFTCD